MKIFNGSSNESLAQKIAQKLKIGLGKIEISSFPNNEGRVWVKEDVNNQNCVVVQSFAPHPNKNIIELLLIIDALVRAGAEKIFAVIPWLAYSLQDKVFRTGEPIAAKVIAKMISDSGVNRVFTTDLHNDSVVGFFDIPVMHYSARDLFVNYIKSKVGKNSVVVSPDFGAMKRSRTFAQDLKLTQASINKERDRSTGELTIHGISNGVKGKICLIFDDLINTGRTVASTAKYLKMQGAEKVYFFATHHLYLKEAFEALEKSPVDKVVVSDSIYSPTASKWKKLEIISLATMFAQGIKKWL
jgi:ribose-phosphate pyrophosphokinase